MRSKGPQFVGLVMQVVEWLFWMTAFKSSTGGECDPDSKDSVTNQRKIILELRKQMPVIEEAYQLLGVPTPDMVAKSDRIVKSCFASPDCKIDGFLDCIDCCIAMALDPYDSPTLVCLDIGAHHSTIDEDFLLKRLPDADIKPLPQPFTTHGIGGGREVDETYAILDIYVPATVAGAENLANMTHQFTVVKDKENPVLLGSDLILMHGIIIDPGAGKITISSCQWAVASLILRSHRIMQ